MGAAGRCRRDDGGDLVGAVVERAPRHLVTGAVAGQVDRDAVEPVGQVLDLLGPHPAADPESVQEHDGRLGRVAGGLDMQRHQPVSFGAGMKQDAMW
jgi:hypothetical protein